MPCDNYFTYERRDALVALLGPRVDLRKRLPEGGTRLDTASIEFWSDVEVRFARGEWADAITAIEQKEAGQARHRFMRSAA